MTSLQLTKGQPSEDGAADQVGAISDTNHALLSCTQDPLESWGCDTLVVSPPTRQSPAGRHPEAGGQKAFCLPCSPSDQEAPQTTWPLSGPNTVVIPKSEPCRGVETLYDLQSHLEFED